MYNIKQIQIEDIKLNKLGNILRTQFKCQAIVH